MQFECWGASFVNRCGGPCGAGGPPDLTGLGFGGLIGSADLRLADRSAESPVYSVAPPFCHRQGGTHIRLCTHKVEHTKGGLWPRQESCYLRDHRQGSAHRRRCTHKAVHTQGGTHKKRCVATAGVMLFKGPQARWYT